MNDQAGIEPMDKTMSEHKELTFNVGEYPELDGLEEGAPVKLVCEGTIANGQNGNVMVQITGVQVETEGQVDRDYRAMRGDESRGAAALDAGDEF